jgi:hypothetical protein
MQRVIHGFGDVVVLEGEYNPTSWDVRVFEVNGHREISARNSIDWVEVEECYRRDLDEPKSEKARIASEEERHLKNLKRSARRAQSMCRKVIKASGFNEMLTLTYRANQTCRELCKKHFKEWARRMKRALGDFQYCASFEAQERGAMHVHLACHKLPSTVLHKGVKIQSWRLGTAIWRSIVGADNGLCFVGGRNAKGNQRKKQMSLAKMASYVSKYILKDFEFAPEETNRYSRSDGIKVPKAVVMRFTNMSLAEIVVMAFQCDDGDVIVSHRADPLNGAYWLCTEPNPDRVLFH